MCSCLSCPAGRLLLGGRCLKTAPRGYYESKNGLWFLRCHGACLDCFGGRRDQCNSCPKGKKLVGDSCVGCSAKAGFVKWRRRKAAKLYLTFASIINLKLTNKF